MGRALPKKFYNRDALVVAPELLGMHLVRRRDGIRQVGRIVEVEAYQGPEDLAAHSAGGRRTLRTEVMFGPPGHAYVYLIYGMHHCLNVVTAPCGIPHAVLIRALEPVAGIDTKTRGPGLLCQALGIDRNLNTHLLTGGALSIERPASVRPPLLRASERIGIAYAKEWARKPWRFVDASSAHLSR